MKPDINSVEVHPQTSSGWCTGGWWFTVAPPLISWWHRDAFSIKSKNILLLQSLVSRSLKQFCFATVAHPSTWDKLALVAIQSSQITLTSSKTNLLLHERINHGCANATDFHQCTFCKLHQLQEPIVQGFGVEELIISSLSVENML
jgi:hypothetical protein